MIEKLSNTINEWVDPDDAPELTEAFFQNGVWFDGEKRLSPAAGTEAFRKALRGRPKADAPKKSVTIRLDANVVSRFKATGKGWQTRMNAALKQYLLEHSLAT